MSATVEVRAPHHLPAERVRRLARLWPAPTGYARSPVDKLHVISYGLLALVLIALGRWGKGTLLGFERDLFSLLRIESVGLRDFVGGVLTVLVYGVLGGFLVVIVWVRRFRLFGYLLAANVLGAAAAIGARWLILGSSPPTLKELSLTSGSQFPTTWNIAQLFAVYAALAPFISVRWRRLGALSLTAIVVGRLTVANFLPLELFAALAVGATAGAIVLLLFGRPDRPPSEQAMVAALRGAGLPIVSVEPTAHTSSRAIGHVAVLEDGTRSYVKVWGEQQRSADLLFRIYRFLRLKHAGDERPFSSLRRLVEHEALVALMAREGGVPTPRLQALALVDPDSVLVSFDLIDGRPLGSPGAASVQPARLMQRVLDGFVKLRRRRIAHRDIRPGTVLVDRAGAISFVGLGFAEIAAQDQLLDIDVAQLMAMLTLTNDVESVVRATVDTLGRDAVATALPYLQPAALSNDTRHGLSGHTLKRLQHEVATVCDVEQPKLEEIYRFGPKTLLTLAVIAGVIYFLLPQFTDLPAIWKRVERANWAWGVAAAFASVATYGAASVSLLGSVPQKLSALRTFLVQIGTSFTSTLAPGGLGGMALNVRFLQRAGVDPPVAVTGVGLNAFAGLVMHILLLVVFSVFGGAEAFGGIHLPHPLIILIAVGGVLAASGLALLVPLVRRLVLSRALAILKQATRGLGQILTRPLGLVMLFGGSVLVTFSYIVCLYFSVMAFGGHVSFVSVSAVYLVGATIASVAPTPGGLGALEAALIAGLVAAGLASATAIPTVFLYRLVTFWLPILPGWISFQWMRRQEIV